MNRSESISALAAAMAKAQGEVGIAIKNAVNPHLKNKYADLGAVWDAVAPALKANGLSVLQMPCPSDDGKLHLETMLLHTSGEYISSVMVMPISKQDPQGYGSALSYARRYSLASMMGVTQDDDDGDRARKSEEAKASEPATAAQLQHISTMLESYGRTWEQLSKAHPIAKKYAGMSPEAITAPDAAEIAKFLQKKLAEAANAND